MQKPLFKNARIALIAALIAMLSDVVQAQQSVARQWSEVMLACIRKDKARPTVQARNICHLSVAMYDAWAVYDDNSDTYFLGKTWGNYQCPFDGVPLVSNQQAAQEEAISYAMYRMLYNRYQSSPGWANFTSAQVNQLMMQLGFDPSVTSTDYTDGDPAKLGNYIAQQMIAYGLQDGANQANDYASQYYENPNPNLHPQLPGNPGVVDPNRWQPLSLTLQLDQNGFPVPNGQPALTPEFGNVTPFAMTEDDATIHVRDGQNWKIYHDPGPPPYLDTTVQTGLENMFKWGYVMNIIWASQHTTADGVMIDASPGTQGNVPSYPQDFSEYASFYDLYNGFDISQGYTINPATGQPYAPQMVPRGDFTRVLSEYWADGPSSETPPGHWIKITNWVNDQPELVRRWQGQGPELSPLEWDVRCYLAVGGGLLDAAITCWGIKGAYDYTRPIFAIRWMADRGQSSDPMLPHYHPAGLPLIPGYIELVMPGDPLAGTNNENLYKIKIYSWLGPPTDPVNTVSGVGWLLAENWWTFQKATFVTPPFPGYTSGHSTYSRTSAEVLTRITGDPYFPGGMYEYTAQAGQFLAAEDGPSVDVTLQWAKYIDASDQCSLSRIYGGLHPPQDDINGRLTGMIVGPEAFDKADQTINAGVPRVVQVNFSDPTIGIANDGGILTVSVTFNEPMNSSILPTILPFEQLPLQLIETSWNNDNTCLFTYSISNDDGVYDHVRFKVDGAQDLDGKQQFPVVTDDIRIDFERPAITSETPEASVITMVEEANGSFHVTIAFNEAMDTGVIPTITLTNGASAVLAYNAANTIWSDAQTLETDFTFTGADADIQDITVNVTNAADLVGNGNSPFTTPVFSINLAPPVITNITSSNNVIADANVGGAITLTIQFNEPMNTSEIPLFSLDNGDAISSMIYNGVLSQWTSSTTFDLVYNVVDQNIEVSNIGIIATGAQDAASNIAAADDFMNILNIDTKNPELLSHATSSPCVSDQNAGNAGFNIALEFSEAMSLTDPSVEFPGTNPTGSMSLNFGSSGWVSSQNYTVFYNITDQNVDLGTIAFEVNQAKDVAGNAMNAPVIIADGFCLDTQNPTVVLTTANTYNVQPSNVETGFDIIALFSETMNTTVPANITFPLENPSSVLTASGSGSTWLNPTTYRKRFDVTDNGENQYNIDVLVTGATDAAGNNVIEVSYADFFDIEMNPTTVEERNGAGHNLMVYPNPVVNGNLVNLEWLKPVNHAQVSVYSITGALVNRTQLNKGGSRLSLSTEDMASGVYVLQILSDGVMATYNLQVVK